MVEACDAAGIAPLIAPGRGPHHPAPDERFAPAPPAPEDPTPLDAIKHRLKTPVGRGLYALREHTVAPVSGIIESVLGFRQFSLHGLAGAPGERSLVTMAWNTKRMVTLSQAAARQGPLLHRLPDNAPRQPFATPHSRPSAENQPEPSANSGSRSLDQPRRPQSDSL